MTYVACPTCAGIDFGGCELCSKRGYISVEWSLPGLVTCANCDGDGLVLKSDLDVGNCPECDGWGHMVRRPPCIMEDA